MNCFPRTVTLRITVLKTSEKSVASDPSEKPKFPRDLSLAEWISITIVVSVIVLAKNGWFG